MSVITATTAWRLDTCPFEVHVAASDRETTIVTGAGHPGDPDLVLHSAVCRDHGLAIVGPPPAEVFAAISPERILAAITRELRWALDHACAAYAVLNACRALRFADDGHLCSKLDGGKWYLDRHPSAPVVTAAVTHQLCGEQAPVTGDAPNSSPKPAASSALPQPPTPVNALAPTGYSVTGSTPAGR